MKHVVLLRGVNVGGMNKIPMPALREVLSESFEDVQTYIQSGNVVLTSDLTPAEVSGIVEELLPRAFTLTSVLVRALVLDAPTYQQVLAQAPAGYGDDPDTYRYDVGFYVGVSADEVRPHVSLNPEVEQVHFGDHAFYHRRTTALATRSRLSKIVGTPVYSSLTLRNWRTTSALAGMLSGDG
jgi:uncharacterized protein (DUF1697 family)